MKENLPKRKNTRLSNYDYSRPGAYFITVCTQNRKMLFKPVGADSISARMIETVFLKTIERYEHVKSNVFVVMPNHFHAIIEISRADIESAPTVSDIIRDFKRHSTLEYIKLVKDGSASPFDKHVWQRSYHDHIIRDRDDYEMIARYIAENPIKWKFDRFYVEE